VLRIVDVCLVPLLIPASLLLRTVRRLGVHRLPASRATFVRLGVFPLRNHYYEPQFDYRHTPKPFSMPRALQGIDWNLAGQLALLRQFQYADELRAGLPKYIGGQIFNFDNGSFERADAGFWYSMIRLKKPRRIIEIGCGQSTLLAIQAVGRNHAEDRSYACAHVCIEPFEAPWLERLGLNVIRRKVEDVDLEFFGELDAGDFLFVDSSHVIRPQGDVLFEILEILPILKIGVIVHFHDMFSPRNYPSDCLVKHVWFWNEQYVLEAFLTHNTRWRITAALNLLKHDCFDELHAKLPQLQPSDEPGSFYITRVA
jgi:hypothetical protein